MSRLNVLVLGAPFLNEAFMAAGHNVVSAGPEHQHHVVVSHPIRIARLLDRIAVEGFVPQVVLYLDNGNLPQFLDVESLPLPQLFYAIDTFCNPWHVPYANAFDGVLMAQKSYGELFGAQGHWTEWMPLFCRYVQPFSSFDKSQDRLEACDTPSSPSTGTVSPSDCLQRDIPVAFVGTLHPKNIPQRFPFLQRFREHFPLFIMQGDYEPVFRRAHIVLNQTAFSELNFRCFEAMGCGAALLMESCEGLTDLFTPGVDILPPYPRDNAAAAVAVAAKWLAQPHELAQVAQAGRDLVTAKHTAAVRVERLIALFNTMLHEKTYQKRLADLPRRQKLLSSAYMFIASELNSAAMQQHKIFYKNAFTSLS